MSLSALIPAGLILLGGYGWQNRKGQNSAAAHHRLQGLQDIMELRRLLEAMPQHRGMANALLQGDESFREKLQSLQRQIDADLKPVEAMAASGRWGVAERVRQIVTLWSGIKQQLASFSGPESFQKHTALVSQILYLLNDVGEASGLLHSAGRSVEASLADVIINQIPPMTETMGQARGMGTGVVVQGRCATAARVKLSYLLQKTRQVSTKVVKALTAALNQDAALKRQAGSTLESMEAAAGGFLDMLEGEVIITGPIKLSSTDYFNAGTGAIQRSFALLDTLIAALQARLISELEHHGRQLWLARGCAVLALAPVVFLVQLAW